MTSVDPAPLPSARGWVALDAEGRLSPLRGRLPPAAGRFPAPLPATARRRLPDSAFVTIVRLVPAPGATAGPANLVPVSRGRLERKHKLMLALAALILALGASNARRTWRPPAVLVEEPAGSGHTVAKVPGVAAPQNPLL